jgi:hypothetical protein
LAYSDCRYLETISIENLLSIPHLKLNWSAVSAVAICLQQIDIQKVSTGMCEDFHASLMPSYFLFFIVNAVFNELLRLQKLLFTIFLQRETTALGPSIKNVHIEVAISLL